MAKTNDIKPANMAKEPWLTGLDEDWPSQPSTPCSLPHSPTLPSSGHKHSTARKCISCEIRSRIPKPEAPSPRVRGLITPRGAKQTQARRGGSTTPTSARASPSPRASSSPRASRSSTNTPSQASPKTSAKQPTPARKKPSSTPLKNVMSARSSSVASDRMSDLGTIQVRAGKEDTKGTPEWKRRIVRGEISADEQCDLFAPMGLENIFKQPATAAGSEVLSSFAIFSHPENDAQVQAAGGTTDKGARRRVSFKNNPEKEYFDEESVHLKVRTTSSRRGKYGLDGVSDADSRLRSASGEEELRNEDLTPIFLSSNGTVERRTGSGVLQSALKQLGGMSEESGQRQDKALSEDKENGEAATFLPNELLGVSSPYFPEDLSTGTQEALRTQPFVTIERGGFSDGSFQLRQLSPSSFPSNLQSSVLTNSKIRSSPPTVNHDNRSAIPTISFSPEGEPGSERPQTANVSSPLKLFANHDTFTNNKLLRRMSQFEETFQDVSDDDEPASPSLIARRTRTTNRNLPVLRRGHTHPQRSDRRPATQDAANPRMNSFRKGRFNFGFASQESSLVPSLSFQQPYVRERQLRQRSTSQNTVNERLRKTKSLENLPENGTSTRALQRRLSRHSNSRRSSQGIYQSIPNVRRISNMSSRTTAPKRRRTLQQTEEQSLDATELIESVLNMSLEDKKAWHQSQVNMINSSSLNSEQAGVSWAAGASGGAFYRVDDSIEDALSQDDHKRSLTTQDFLDEATKVMSIIRSKNKYTSGLASVEESHITGEDDEEDEMSSRENLSRPPSREGVDMRKFREPRPMHPRVVSHLKKFADKEDTEQFMASVMSDLYKENQPMLDGSMVGGNATSSPHDVRILPQRKRKFSDDDAPMHSIPTVSSNGSNTKGVIASDMVSHLIPEQVNGMNYDRTTKSWVKQKVNHNMRSEDSEDDPFGSIPDLSYDELEELKKAQEFTSPRKDGQTADAEQTGRADRHGKSGSEGTERPVTREGNPFIPDSSSVQSKTTRFTSSGPQPETRATSWGTEDLTVNIGRFTNPGSKKLDGESTTEQETLLKQPKQSMGSNSKRAATISFSSPLVSHISYADDGEDVSTSDTIKAGQHERQTDHRASTVAPSRRTSFDGKPFIGRPISRIDERTEESYAEMSLIRRNSTGSTPLRGERSMILPSSARDDNYSFHMSSLAEFTVHQTDYPINPEPSYVAPRTHPTSLRQIHGTFALATEDLIRHITDVEPTEPFWEQLRRLSLRDKGIATLHQLDKFCPLLEELDVSENELVQLDGTPSTLRDLHIQHNSLTNLTSWGHLINLQYLDVSGNQLETLDGFSGLFHLRELRANNNRIRNIKGVFGLNGLLRLELKHNNLTSVNFEGSELIRLSELDLSNNQITAVKHIEYLQAIETLDLSENQMRELQTPMPIRSLRSFKVSSNRLSNFDASYYPKLRLLYLDNNYLTTVSGLAGCSGIEVFSVREQFSGQSPEEGASLDIDLSPLGDARKIFLSSNRLSDRTLSPSVPMLGLQLLDIASCGIRVLPGHFGKDFPNLRVLNLNFNSVSDLGSIADMRGLSRLTAAGNRISRLRMLCQVVARVGRSSQHDYSSLRTIDLRNNPLTVGFYPPPVSGSGRADTHIKMLEDRLHKTQKRQNRIESGSDLLPEMFGEVEENAVVGFKGQAATKERITEVEINDPYTLPPADAEADQKYRLRLDGSTKSKRMTLEVMLYAGTGGSVRVLDGLELRPILEQDKAEVDRLWSKLEQLGVFTKKTPNSALCQ
ncbi:hypothetical protein EYB26_002063 [Talaromyces marneffei]|uniref:uncharacterized protein n=1 Tax=Talaromyces marneffei TaxID=37727 RepID=UPI0012A9942D|nr:uncharacterized protein EYB26_002063 [Talaromyces marneffei]QGA14410.1 hypothetical protein EYB26_002063 [Talaromyces marneffei]